ncbi:ORF29B [Aviadenovirus cerasi]|uniref:ORF29B n=1 Tax=Fowl aviadenovirus 5 TaxID=172861 RepID=A0A6M3Z508_9ADEN|nr:ORF29B [Fowl aviadenovirus 5]
MATPLYTATTPYGTPLYTPCTGDHPLWTPPCTPPCTFFSIGYNGTLPPCV